VTGATPTAEGLGAALRRAFRRFKAPTARPHRGPKSASKMDNAPHWRHALEPEVSRPRPWKAKRASTTGAPGARLLQLDGHHIQFNVGRRRPWRRGASASEQHRGPDRARAGYSDYFCDLTTALQEEIIARTEQTGF